MSSVELIFIHFVLGFSQRSLLIGVIKQPMTSSGIQ